MIEVQNRAVFVDGWNVSKDGAGIPHVERLVAIRQALLQSGFASVDIV
jgi:hypothetical protein